jgi:hypothetical protein
LTARVRDLIHAVDPYLGFDETTHPDDLQGWGGHPDFWGEMVRKSHATNVLEVGSWKGRSAAAIAAALKDLHIDSIEFDPLECALCGGCLIERDHAMSRCPGPSENPELVCVDTWLGATEFYDKFDDLTRYAGLGMLHGYPTVYYQFLANMKRRGLDRFVTPFAQSSINALRFLERKRVRFDMIYIDGSHEYRDVEMDLRYAWPLLKEGGLLVGDDYCEHWQGVIRAVDEFVGEHGLSDTFEHRQYPGEKYPSDYWIVRRPYE